MVEKFSLDIFLVESSDAIAKVDVAMHGVPRLTRPAPMAEGSLYYGIICIRVGFFNSTMNSQRSGKVLGVIPAAYQHNSRLYLAVMFQQASFLPELVIVGMVNRFLPEKIIVVILVSIFKRPHVQQKLVTIPCAGFKHSVPGLSCRISFLNAKHREGEKIAFEESAIMMEIIKKE